MLDVGRWTLMSTAWCPLYLSLGVDYVRLSRRLSFHRYKLGPPLENGEFIRILVFLLDGPLLAKFVWHLALSENECVMRFLAHPGRNWLQGSWSSRDTPAGQLMSAFCALRLYFAPLENKVQAS